MYGNTWDTYLGPGGGLGPKMAGPPDTEDLGEPRGDRKWSWVLSLEIFCILRKGISRPEGKQLVTICHPLLAHQALPYASQPAS